MGAWLHSTNGGINWNAQFISAKVPVLLNDVDTYTTASKVYFIAVANTGTIVISTDGGTTLNQFSGLINATLNGVSIDVRGNAFTVAKGNGAASPYTIFRSQINSNYQTWINISPPGSSSSTFQAVTTFDSANGHIVAVGLAGVVYVTFNALGVAPTWALATGIYIHTFIYAFI